MAVLVGPGSGVVGHATLWRGTEAWSTGCAWEAGQETGASTAVMGLRPSGGP